MKTRTNFFLIFLVVLTYGAGLCNTRAFYDPGTQKWLNRDPLGDLGSLVYFTPTLVQDIESDDSSGMTADELLGAWDQVNLNLHAFVGNNPIGAIDPEGLQCLVVQAEFIPTTAAIAESGIKIGVDASAKVATDAGAKTAETAGKGAEPAKPANPEKEIQNVRNKENPIDQAKDMQKAQDNIRKGKYEGGQIDRMTGKESRMKKALNDIANNPHLADDLSVVNAPQSTCNQP